ncbi:hypothetical protein [Sphingobium estronivorans]|uniref:hypothetical protein n=1 Tax=Sphingobium estronivorans TaxID=1577690 RepID=UPI001F07D5B1|nr:hypothetical protein [Sphingobium estronivorans]
MRAIFLLPLLALAACDEKKDDPPGVVTNIVDQAAPEPRQAPEAENALRTAESAPPPSSVGSTIPASIQGRWTGLEERCDERAAEMKLTVTPTSLVFLESEGKVTGMSHGPDGRIRIDAAFTGEGQSWNKTLELRPSASGRELTVIDDGRAVTRKRCG